MANDEIKTCPLCGGRVFWFPVSNYWGCENCKNTLSRYTVFPDEVKKTSASAVGNAAAMREALVVLTDKLIDYLQKGLIQLPLPLEEATAKARAALSAPPRNCDRFATVKDAAIAFARERQDAPHPCPDFTFAEWLLAPATKKKGGAE